MKCNKCQSEWNGIKEFDNCPFCGASLKQPIKQGNFETVDEFFSYALETFGLELLSDSRKLLSYFTDLAPTLSREKNLLRMAIESGVYKEILSSNGDGDSEKENCFTRCKIILVDNYFLQSDWADKVIHWLTDYLGWKAGKTQQIDTQQSTQQQTVAAQRPVAVQPTVRRFAFPKSKKQRPIQQTAQRPVVTPKFATTQQQKTIVSVKEDVQVDSFQHLVSAGDNKHTVGLKKDGTVVAVGFNGYDKCNVSSWRDIVAVSAGFSHTVGLKKDGTVVAVGDNQYGQCNVSSWRDIVAVSAGAEHTIGLKKDGTVVAVGANQHGQCNVSSWRDIVAVSAGSGHTVGLKKDGTVVAVGRNSSAPGYNFEWALNGLHFIGDKIGEGQCDVSSWRDIVAISAGSWHTVGLKKDGTVVAVGDNEYGQCNVSSWQNIVAISAGDYHTVGLKKDGTVVAVGKNEYGQCNVSSWRDIVAVSAGDIHTVGLKKDGTVVAVGHNEYGQCDVSSWNLFN